MMGVNKSHLYPAFLSVLICCTLKTQEVQAQSDMARSCDNVSCPSGTYCLNGQCVISSCDVVDCGPDKECILQVVQCYTTPCLPIPTCKPINKCATVRCRSGYMCFDGRCIKVPTCDGFQCGPEEECFLQSVTCIRAPCLPVPACRPKLTCATINCISGYYCVDRKCIPLPSCEGINCGPGKQCYLETKECFAPPCPPPQPVCRGSCANILCPANSNCVNGQCVPIKQRR